MEPYTQELKKNFARKMTIAARDILARKYKIFDLNLAKLIASQAMHESAWGEKPTGTYNYYGMKAKQGEPYTLRDTHELINGKYVKVKSKFKNYNSFEEGINELIDRLLNLFDINTLKNYNPYDYSLILKKNDYYTANLNDYYKSINGIFNGKLYPNSVKDIEPLTKYNMLKLSFEIPTLFETPVDNTRINMLKELYKNGGKVKLIRKYKFIN